MWPFSVNVYVLMVLVSVNDKNPIFSLKLLHSDLDEEDEENGEVDTSAGRFVRYQFTPAFLKLRTVGAT